MQNLTLKSAVVGILFLGSMGLANAASGDGIAAHQSVSQMRGTTAEVNSDRLEMGRSVGIGNVGSTTCQLPEPAISPNGIGSLSQMAVCR